MAEHTYPVLTGGTFFTLILEARRPRTGKKTQLYGAKDSLSEPNTLAGLVRVMYTSDDSFHLPSDSKGAGTITANYKSCTDNGVNLPFAYGKDVGLFDERVKENYPVALARMTEYTAKFLDTSNNPDKAVWLIKAILDTVEHDDTILPEAEFYVFKDGTAIKKAALGGISEYCVESFLLGVWHYIIINLGDQNTRGAETFNTWCPPNNRRTRSYHGNMGEGQEYKDRHIKVVSINSPTIFAEITATVKTVPLSLDSYATYRENAYIYFSKVRTVLYDKTPKKFYNFYVCNDLKYDD